MFVYSYHIWKNRNIFDIDGIKPYYSLTAQFSFSQGKNVLFSPSQQTVELKAPCMSFGSNYFVTWLKMSIDLLFLICWSTQMRGMYKDVPQMSIWKFLQVTGYGPPRRPPPKMNFLKKSPPMNSTSIANWSKQIGHFTGFIHQWDSEWELRM